MKGKIKKIISLLLMAVMLFGCFGITGCRKNEPVTDGEFIYEYSETKSYGPFYSIIGSTEEGQKYKENVYVPTHYNGVPIRLTFTTESGAYFGTTTTYSMQVNCKNLYFNYIQEYEPIFHGVAECAFYTKTEKRWSLSMSLFIDQTLLNIGYVNALMYDYIKRDVFACPAAEMWQEKNEFTLQRGMKVGSEVTYNVYVIKADISYMFNYENAPNEGYFFINNFENGELIDNTPYEPLREGYMFEGWYKEPECINVWDFEKDRYYQKEEEGNLIFTELKLYAKWIKK